MPTEVNRLTGTADFPGPQRRAERPRRIAKRVCLHLRNRTIVASQAWKVLLAYVIRTPER
jgi:hypothetical protein